MKAFATYVVACCVARPRIGGRFNAAAEKLAQDAARLESELEAAQVRTPTTVRCLV